MVKVVGGIREWRLQAAAVTALRRAIDAGAPMLIAGDMNSAKRNIGQAGIAKATGMEAGEPDLRVYLPGGRLGLIEFKTASGRLSPAQKSRHAVLRQLGHTVEVVHAATEDEARDKAMAIVRGWLAANDNCLPEIYEKPTFGVACGVRR